MRAVMAGRVFSHILFSYTILNTSTQYSAPLPTLKSAKTLIVFGSPGYHGGALQDRHGFSGPARGPRPAFKLAGPYTSLQT